MLIGIATVDYNLTGFARFHVADTSDLTTQTRRVSRTPTLDGGCLITDQGYSAADRTMKIRSAGPLSGEVLARLQSMHQSYSLVDLCTPEGVFRGVMQQFTAPQGIVSITFLVKEQVNG